MTPEIPSTTGDQRPTQLSPCSLPRRYRLVRTYPATPSVLSQHPLWLVDAWNQGQGHHPVVDVDVELGEIMETFRMFYKSKVGSIDILGEMMDLRKDIFWSQIILTYIHLPYAYWCERHQKQLAFWHSVDIRLNPNWSKFPDHVFDESKKSKMNLVPTTCFPPGA